MDTEPAVVENPPAAEVAAEPTEEKKEKKKRNSLKNHSNGTDGSDGGGDLQKLEEKATKAQAAFEREEKLRKELESLNTKLLAEKTALLESLSGEKGQLQEFQEKTAKLTAQKNDLDNQLRVSTQFHVFITPLDKSLDQDYQVSTTYSMAERQSHVDIPRLIPRRWSFSPVEELRIVGANSIRLVHPSFGTVTQNGVFLNSN